MVSVPRPAALEQDDQDTEQQPNSERRLVGRALTGWETLRGDRRFPGLADYGHLADGEISDKHFLIAMGDNEESDEFVGAGANLKQALRIDPVGKKVKEVLP